MVGWQWCRRYKRTPNSFDLSKIRAKSLKTWEKSLKIWAKWYPTFFCFKKMAPSVCRKWSHTKNHPKKGVHDLWGRKSHKNILGKFGEIWAKILRTPKNFPAPTPMFGEHTNHHLSSPRPHTEAVKIQGHKWFENALELSAFLMTVSRFREKNCVPF